MRVERAADSVAENTPMVIIHGRALMYWRHKFRCIITLLLQGVDNVLESATICT